MRGSIEPKSSKVLVLAAVVGMILPPFTVYADAGGASSNDEPETASDQLVTVVVTATKRTSTVQTTPMSITAVTSAEIASRGVTDFDTLARSVPGLSMRSSGGPGQT